MVSLLITIICPERIFHKQIFLFQILFSYPHVNTQLPTHANLPSKMKELLLKLELHQSNRPQQFHGKVFTTHRQAIKMPSGNCSNCEKRRSHTISICSLYTHRFLSSWNVRSILLVCSGSKGSALASFLPGNMVNSKQNMSTSPNRGHN